MSNEVVTIKVTPEDYIIKYLQLRTFNLLPKQQYRVLAEITKEGLVDTEGRKRIREKLGLSTHSLNNVLLSLKRKGILLHDTYTQTYQSKLFVPENCGAITFKFIEQ